MFKIAQSNSYSWPVVVELPASGGTRKKETFTVEFARLSQPRIREIGTQIADGTITDDVLCKEIVVGWSDIQGQDGHEMPFSSAALADLLKVQLVAGAIVKAFMESLSGARTKN